jgi:hypothetical protein
VVAQPQVGEHGEAEQVGEELREAVLQLRPEVVTLGPTEVGEADRQDEQRQGDRKHAVAQGNGSVVVELAFGGVSSSMISPLTGDDDCVSADAWAGAR